MWVKHTAFVVSAFLVQVGETYSSTSRESFDEVTEGDLFAARDLGLSRELLDCGIKGSACCTSSTIYGNGYCDDQNKRACHSIDQLCVDCGKKGEPCCNTENGLTCDSDRQYCKPETTTCENCGKSNQICCPDGAGNLTRCLNDVSTTCDTTLSTPTCKNCGDTGQICCGGPNPCDSSDDFCDSETNTCVDCGGHGQPCCPGSSCDDDIRQSCVNDGTDDKCFNCGLVTERCCEGIGKEKCNFADVFCNAASYCQSCGGNNEPCCPDPTGGTMPGAGTCDDSRSLTCVVDSGESETGGVCKRCGGNQEVCCDGNTCDSDFSICDENNMCVSCGSQGEKCCEGNACRNQASNTCYTMHENATCDTCGYHNQLTCEGFRVRECKSEYSLIRNGMCEDCGADGQQCCHGPKQCKSSSSGCHTHSNGDTECMKLRLHPSASPSSMPSDVPTSNPSAAPTESSAPSDIPSISPSVSPSVSPTVRPTRSLVPTSSPTKSAAPTLIHEATCPPIGSSQEVPPSILTIDRSNSSVLCQIVLVNGDIRKPVARSYDGGEWHQYSGGFSDMAVSCYLDECTFELGEPAGGQYMLSSTNGYTVTDEQKAARFFEAATFGMNKSSISALANQVASSGDDAFAAWIKTQMNENLTPMSSLREFFRSRANGKKF